MGVILGGAGGQIWTKYSRKGESGSLMETWARGWVGAWSEDGSKGRLEIKKEGSDDVDVIVIKSVSDRLPERSVSS